MKLVLKGGPTSGWYSPPKGTHSGEQHREVGSGKVRLVGKKPKPVAKRKFGQIPKPNQDTLRHVVWQTHDSIASYTGDDASARKIGKQIVDNLREQVDGKPVCVNMPAKAAHLILDDGKFKNQHETGTSRGMLDPKARKRAELSAFEYTTSPTASDLPIYGYIDDGPKWTGMLGYRCSGYGDVTFVLKDSVRTRTTVTVGDSLSKFSMGIMTGTPLTKVGLEGVDGEWRRAYERDWKPIQYIEAQIHGGVTLGDISKIIVRSGARVRMKLSAAEFTTRAESLGIVVEYEK